MSGFLQFPPLTNCGATSYADLCWIRQFLLWPTVEPPPTGRPVGLFFGVRQSIVVYCNTLFWKSVCAASLSLPSPCDFKFMPQGVENLIFSFSAFFRHDFFFPMRPTCKQSVFVRLNKIIGFSWLLVLIENKINFLIYQKYFGHPRFRIEVKAQSFSCIKAEKTSN